jgi:hypothetical protein
MTRANPLPPDSKAEDNSKIERERSANVSGASVKNKVVLNRAAVNKAAVNRVVASNPDDKTGSFEPTSGGR